MKAGVFKTCKRGLFKYLVFALLLMITKAYAIRLRFLRHVQRAVSVVWQRCFCEQRAGQHILLKARLGRFLIEERAVLFNARKLEILCVKV